MTHCEDCGRPVELARKLTETISEWWCERCSILYLR